MNKMDKQDIKEWNDKANKLKEYVNLHFLNGCDGMDCETCEFYNDIRYCDFIQYVSDKED